MIARMDNNTTPTTAGPCRLSEALEAAGYPPDDIQRIGARRAFQLRQFGLLSGPIYLGSGARATYTARDIELLAVHRILHDLGPHGPDQPTQWRILNEVADQGWTTAVVVQAGETNWVIAPPQGATVDADALWDRVSA